MTKLEVESIRKIIENNINRLLKQDFHKDSDPIKYRSIVSYNTSKKQSSIYRPKISPAKAVGVKSNKYGKEIENYKVEVRLNEPDFHSPHFHVTKGERKFSVSLSTGEIIEDNMKKFLRSRDIKLIKDIWESNYEYLWKLWNDNRITVVKG